MSTGDHHPQVGWKCPNCGAGMAPWAMRCGCADRPVFRTYPAHDTTGCPPPIPLGISSQVDVDALERAASHLDRLAGRRPLTTAKMEPDVKELPTWGV